MQELLKKLNKINVKIDLVDEKLDIQAPKGVMTEDLLNEIKLYKNDLIEFISQHKSKKEKHSFIPKVEEQSSYVLSSSQNRLWLLSQFEEGNIAYNMPSVFELKGNVNISALEKAFKSLIERHESLRTIFKEEESGQVRQFILSADKSKFQLQFEDVSQDKNITEIVKEIVSAETNYSFDLSSDSLVRAKLIKTSEDTFVFVCVMHHIISDGQSSELMSKELFTLYDSLVKGNDNPLPILPIQYKDYAAWQQEIIKNKDFESYKSYWLQKLDGEIPVLDLPTYQIRPVVKTYNGKQINRTFSLKLSKNFNDLCKSQGSTLFMGLLTIAKTLLYRYTHQTDIVIGSPIAGREHADLQNQIGFYVNTLALRTQFTGKDTFNELLTKVKEVTLGAYKHQIYPFDELIASLPLERDLSRNPLFDVMVTYQNEENLKTGVQIIDNIEIKKFQSEDETLSKFDMDFVFSETINGINLGLTYNTDIYSEEFIATFLNHFNNLLQEITINPEKELADLEFLSSEEKQQILYDFNNTRVDCPKNKTIIDLFEEQVAKTPNNIAISFEEKSLTYQELNQKANQVASFLRENHVVKSDDLIGIVLDRSANLIISILGVLKSGAAYVPIDSNYPQERIDFIIADSDCKFTIEDKFFNLFTATEYSKEDLDRVNSTNDLAYVIYTSGTTGQPKGVMVEHRNLVNLCYWHASSFEVDEFSRGTLFSGVGFDASVWEIFPYLLNGSSLYPIKNDEIRLNIIEFSNFIKNNKISHCYLPSAICNELANSQIPFDNVKFLTGGEALKIDAPSNIEIYNNYGPTENTIVSTFYKLKPNEIGTISIGRPISNTQIYILDEEFNIVPIGVSGKLYISGAGLTRGYLNKPELTAEKFLDNPFEDGAKMYDTGDLGRWMPDGNIEFLGRKDFQVKIRGYRIELGEIEVNISQYSDNIKQVVADVKKVNGENVLACYYTIASEIELDKTHLREYLQSKLPDYMLPSFFVELATIPLTPNGKIDRKALPSVTGLDLVRNEYVAPKNETEQKLAEIWREVLGLEKVGITDNFFELGGHSLMVAQVLNRIHQNLTQQISFKDFFANPTIEGITKNLTQREYKSIPKALEQNNYPLTPSQQRLWVLSQLEGGSQAYNMPAVVTLKGDLNYDYFEKAFKIFIDKHEITRTSFKTDNQLGEIRQYITPKEDVNFKVELLDFTNKSDADIEIYLQKANGEAFNLEQSPLLKASLLKRTANESIFFLSMHHIISDGWSTELLISEVVENYNKLLQGYDIEENITSLSIQYKDYAIWLQEEVKGEKYKKAEVYWLEQFSGELPVLDLPSFKTRPLVQTYNGASATHTYTKSFTDSLKQYSEEQGVTLFMTLMAGITGLLYRYTGQKDIIVGTPIAGREHAQLENQIGLYLNTLAIRTQIEEDKNSFTSLVAKERDVLLSAYEHQIYPFDELVNNLNLKRDTSRSALFDVMVVFQNQNDLEIKGTKEAIQGLEVEDYDYENTTSKFDLTFTFVEQGETLELSLKYNTDIYDAVLVERLLGHLENFLAQGILDSSRDIAIEDIDYLSEKERQELLVDFNATTVDYPKDKTIVELFEEQVAKCPDNVAVVFDNKKISYKELFEKINLIEKYLVNKGISKEDNVIICFDSHLEDVVAAILVTLKVGATYVPIDPDYPIERINFIVNDTKAKIVITNSIDFSLFESIDIPILTLDDLEVCEEEKIYKSNPSINDNAYIIYTSGSTGNPKGVLVTHQNLNDYLFGLANKIEIDKNESFALMSTVATDLGNTVLFSSLLFGKTLHLFSKNCLRDVEYIQNYFRNNEIDCIKIVPSYWKSLNIQIDIYSPNKMIIFGGEELTVEIIEKIKSERPQINILNHYGPTETTIGKLIHIVDLEKRYERIPIGQAFSNTSLFVVDKNLMLCPIGVEGELLIGGDGVSNGYLNNQGLTQDKFIENIFTKTKDKLYRTGDNVVIHFNGDIEFRGRIDNQVKILGHRIELNEIENALNKLEGIKVSVADVIENNKGNKFIVAYIVYDMGELPHNELFDNLRMLLPSIMIPSILIKIDEIPFTSNGKINRKALPVISEEDIYKKEYVAPRNEIEKSLVEIWQEVLGIDKVGITDNFFELGGHSLLLMSIINTINKKIGIVLTFTEFSLNPSIIDLARLITSKKTTDSLLVKIDSNKVLASEAQKTIWVQCQQKFKFNPYILENEYYIGNQVEIGFLKEIINTLFNRHDSLRTVFKKENDQLFQIIKRYDEFKDLFEYVDFKNSPDTELINYKEKEDKEELDLENGPLLKIRLIEKSEGIYIVYKIHHIITDAWSMVLLLNEFNKLLKQGKTEITAPKFQYKDYAAWHNAYLNSVDYITDKNYWNSRLNVDGIKQLLPPFPKENKLQEAKIVNYYFDQNLVLGINQLIKNENVSMFSFLLASVSTLLYKYTNNQDLLIGTSVTGRNHPDFMEQVGFFVNTLVNRVSLKENESFKQTLKRVSNNLSQDFEHTNYPYSHLVNDLNINKDNPLFRVVLRLVTAVSNSTQSTVISNEMKEIGSTYAKVDLDLAFVQGDNQLELVITYDQNVYNKNSIKRLYVHFNTLLNHLVTNPNIQNKKIDMLLNPDKKSIAIPDDSPMVFNEFKPKAKVVLLDENLQHIPIDSCGRIYLEMKNEVLDSRKYSFEQVEWNHSQANVKMLFKTNYFARKTSNSSFNWLGTDAKIAVINGFTVYLKEVEDWLLFKTSIIDCELVVSKVSDREELIGYFVLAEGTNAEDIERTLKKYYPRSMGTVHFLAVESIARDENNLVINELLPELNINKEKRKIIAPRNHIEAWLIDLFKEILQLDDVSVDDNYFEIGGNSLKAMVFVARIIEKYGYELDFMIFFNNPTIEYLSQEIQQSILMNDLAEDTSPKTLKKIII